MTKNEPMPAKFYPVSLKQLLKLIFKELDNDGTGVFGIPQELFFVPRTE